MYLLELFKVLELMNYIKLQRYNVKTYTYRELYLPVIAYLAFCKHHIGIRHHGYSSRSTFNTKAFYRIVQLIYDKKTAISKAIYKDISYLFSVLYGLPD